MVPSTDGAESKTVGWGESASASPEHPVSNTASTPTAAAGARDQAFLRAECLVSATIRYPFRGTGPLMLSSTESQRNNNMYY
ncbi:hypothetical protein GCM10011359_14950 [Nesterenkonia alkaliphila]|nr:hypothetical protein GCM10011359_14950 [Nesterenkonia alkaliphila]